MKTALKIAVSTNDNLQPLRGLKTGCPPPSSN